MCKVCNLYSKTPDELVRTILRAGWKQEDIADTIEVSQATISRILSGRHKDPRYSVVERLRELASKLLELAEGQ